VPNSRSQKIPADDLTMTDISLPLARSNAALIAKALGSRVLANRQVVVGEPACPFRVPLHQESFWITAKIGASHYVIRANPKRGCAEFVTFGISVRSPWQAMGASLLLRSLSAEFGHELYGADSRRDLSAQLILEDATVEQLFRKALTFDSELLWVSDTQLQCIARISRPEQAIYQIQHLARLILQVNQASRRLYPTTAS